MQSGFKLEEVQVPLRAVQSVMHALRRGVAVRTAQQLGVATHLEVYALLGRVQVHPGHFPRGQQALRTASFAT